MRHEQAESNFIEGLVKILARYGVFVTVSVGNEIRALLRDAIDRSRATEQDVHENL